MIATLRTRRTRMLVMPVLLFVLALRAFVPAAHAAPAGGLLEAGVLCAAVKQAGHTPLAPASESRTHCDLCLNPFLAGPPAALRLPVACASAAASTGIDNAVPIARCLQRAQSARGPPSLS